MSVWIAAYQRRLCEVLHVTGIFCVCVLSMPKIQRTVTRSASRCELSPNSGRKSKNGIFSSTVNICRRSARSSRQQNPRQDSLKKKEKRKSHRFSFKSFILFIFSYSMLVHQWLCGSGQKDFISLDIKSGRCFVWTKRKKGGKVKSLALKLSRFSRGWEIERCAPPARLPSRLISLKDTTRRGSSQVDRLIQGSNVVN